MPLPRPKDLSGGPGVGAHHVDKVAGGEWGRASPKEDFAGTEVDQHQRELDGEAEVIGDLRRDEVQASDEGYAEREQCRRADNGVDADDGTDGQRPGEAAGRGSHAEEADEWRDDA